MKRTTIKLEDAVLVQLKREAALRGLSMQDLVNALLKQALQLRAQGPAELELPTFRGTVLPGVRLDDWDALVDLMEGRNAGA